VMLGQAIGMNCKWETNKNSPASEVDSVKWYKDNKEFYRLHPSGPLHEKIQMFPYPGIKVDQNSTQLKVDGHSGEHQLSLQQAELSSSGNYRCQITASKAPFHTEQQDRNLLVIIQPEKPPYMTVSKKQAVLNDVVAVECFSDRSKPGAQLQFYINDNRVHESTVGSLLISPVNNGQLESSSRTLHLRIRANHLMSSSLRVKCVASIGEAYWRTAETTIRLERDPSYTLESRSRSGGASGFGVILLVPLIFSLLHRNQPIL